MKTFAQLTVGDCFYRVYQHSMTYDVKEVKSVTAGEIHWGYSSDEIIPRFKTDKGEDKQHSRYSNGTRTYFCFVYETDAIRYCKAQLMKSLFDKIEEAQKAIEKVKNFRREYHELLNHEWTENKINELERILHQ